MAAIAVPVQPATASSAASMARCPVPMDADVESTTWISRPGCCCAPISALANVPDRRLPTVTHTTDAAPAANDAANASAKAPGAAAAVVGNGASGASIRFQKSSVERSTPARYSSAPNRTRSCLLYTSDAADEEDSVD